MYQTFKSLLSSALSLSGVMVFRINTTLLNIAALCSIADAGKSGNLRKQSSTNIPRGLESCAENESLWTLALTVDDYPWETKWTIKDPIGEKVAEGPREGMNYEKRAEYKDSGCLPSGDYIFTIKDKSGDGMCCQYGEGKFEFKVDDVVLAKSDDKAFKILEYPFTVGGGINPDSLEVDGAVINPETGETGPETNAPSTPRPTYKPTKNPTPVPSSPPSAVSQQQWRYYYLRKYRLHLTYSQNCSRLQATIPLHHHLLTTQPNLQLSHQQQPCHLFLQFSFRPLRCPRKSQVGIHPRNLL